MGKPKPRKKEIFAQALFKEPVGIDFLTSKKNNLNKILFVDCRPNPKSRTEYIEIPGFMTLKQLVRERHDDPGRFNGYKRIVLADESGICASYYLQNQATYYPDTDQLFEIMLLSDEEVFKQLMNPKGRYVRWLRRRPDMVNVLATYAVKVKERAKYDDDIQRVVEAEERESARRSSNQGPAMMKPKKVR